jgi:GTPase SAR1 family protein
MTICLWDPETGALRLKLEGHASSVRSLSFSADSRFLASKSWDATVNIWSTIDWQTKAVLKESNEWYNWHAGVAFHPLVPRLATLAKGDTVIRVWDFDADALLRGKPIVESLRYATARLVLLGDAGVGKTALGWRLAHAEFKEHTSTHGQQFWVINKLRRTRGDGAECDAVLWDLAGQPDYRLVHSLYLDDVDLALLLFDPSDGRKPLSGVDYWISQLKHRGKSLCPCILVGARSDRGMAILTDRELESYCEQQSISGGYVVTSAKTGAGMAALMERLRDEVPWERMTPTVSPFAFKRVKEYVLSLKAKGEKGAVLANPTALRAQLEVLDANRKVSNEEMMTATRHLETHGYISILRSSQGDVFILLAPELLINLAASLVLEARRSPRGLGVLEEDRLLKGEYAFPELLGLPKGDRGILLNAAVVLFLEHNICFRETFNEQTLLVFPSLINEKEPIDGSIPIVEETWYRVRGATQNVYASLVVLLGYTNTFIRTNQWQNQAQYKLGEGEICGFRQVECGPGEIELVLYYGQDTPEHVRFLFRGLLERFLSRRRVDISRYEPAVCPKCGEGIARNVVMMQREKSRDFTFCHTCGARVALLGKEAGTRLPQDAQERVEKQQHVANRRTAFEAASVRIKAILRDRVEVVKRPTCFISYAWGLPEHERWVLQLAKDMRGAEIDVLFDRWHNVPGTSLTRFIDKILETDYVVVVGTPELCEKYEMQKSDPVVAAELRVINTRLRQPGRYGPSVIPVLLAGEPAESLIPQLRDVVSIDFLKEESYFVSLLDLVWRLHRLPFDHPLQEELRASVSLADR